MTHTQTTTSRYMTLGALPFVSLSIGAWLVPPEALSYVYNAFITYSVVIFGFMVGAVWGALLVESSSATDTGDSDGARLRIRNNALSISIFASLFSMVAIALLGVTALAMMLVAYIALPTSRNMHRLAGHVRISKCAQK